MTEEQKEKYANFLDKISEILGLNKPVDILRLCAVTDEYLRPIEKHITELENELSVCNASNSFNKEQLIKAKEIIRKYYKYNPSCKYSYGDIDKEAEQFLKESE